MAKKEFSLFIIILITVSAVNGGNILINSYYISLIRGFY